MNYQKKNLVVFANCHGEKYINIFKRDTNIEELFNINYFVSYQELDNFDHLKKEFENADVLIINRIKNYNKFTIENLKKILKKEVLLIIIPFIRFEGYWLPENYKKLNKFKSNSVSYFPEIDINNINEYLNENIKTEYYLKHYFNCLEKLKNIELESDIKFYDFFVNNHLIYPMFRDNHHPTSNFLEYIGKEIIQIIDIKFKLIKKDETFDLKSDLLEYGHFKPIKNNVKKLLEIKYDLDKIFICSRKDYMTKILNFESDTNNDIIIDLDDMYKKLF